MSGPRNISGSPMTRRPLERGTTSSHAPENLKPTPSLGQPESKERPPVHEAGAANQSTEPKLEPKKGIVGLNAGLALLERHLASVKEAVELKAVPEAPSELHRK